MEYELVEEPLEDNRDGDPSRDERRVRGLRKSRARDHYGQARDCDRALHIPEEE